MDLREKIAEMLRENRGTFDDERFQDDETLADRILAIPEIALGLTMLETPGLGKRPNLGHSIRVRDPD